ncbi:helix-turn-helix domain-containing protein [Modestobacter sp. KNN46-3]|uniref:helix-turn-helix domain-containing protein n=1 Tax=Modestobacter sp. KNN46-3 TaxID=2711218 RepID=UPI0019D0DFB2|nr:helix-turn-helix domain-containing protein [Modestobacter sp. KNN46-3]
MSAGNLPQYVRRPEAARYLGLSVGTLENWACHPNGRGLAFHKVGGIVLYDAQELARFVQARLVQSGRAA